MVQPIAQEDYHRGASNALGRLPCRGDGEENSQAVLVTVPLCVLVNSKGELALFKRE